MATLSRFNSSEIISIVSFEARANNSDYEFWFKTKQAMGIRQADGITVIVPAGDYFRKFLESLDSSESFKELISIEGYKIFVKFYKCRSIFEKIFFCNFEVHDADAKRNFCVGSMAHHNLDDLIVRAERFLAWHAGDLAPSTEEAVNRIARWIRL